MKLFTSYILPILALALSGIFFSGCEDDEIPATPIIVTLETTHASSFGAADGSITASVRGGTPPYNFFWSTGSTDATGISGLTAGSYSLQVIDNNAGVGKAEVMITHPDATPLDIQFQLTPVTFFGGQDGAISITISGGTPPYTIDWETGSDENEISGLLSGYYTVTVTDAGNPAIVTTDSVLLTQPDFVCGRDSITDVDGNRYPTVDLGQCWTKENLRTLNLPNDPMTPIDGAFCAGLNCQRAEGAHYTWAAAMNGGVSTDEGEDVVQGICPTGWHIPSKSEWAELNSYLSVDGNGGAGRNVPNKLRGVDSPSGFDALEAGNWGFSLFPGEYSVFWTATESSNAQATYRLINNFPILGQGNADKSNGLSVRCVQD